MKARLQNDLLKIAVFIFCFGFCRQVAGQDNKPCVAGIYKTEDDLVKDRISHKINTGDEGYKFGFLFPADLQLTIKITKPDSILEFKPGSVYGYHQCGKKFRYWQGGDLLAQEDFYGIEESSGLIIYSSVFISGNERFYSLDLSSPIHRLSMDNLEKDFANSPDFLEAARQLHKKELEGLTSRDGKGRYKINTLFKEKAGRK